MSIKTLMFWRQFSFVKKISIIILCLASLSITGMLISASTSESIQGNAHMINQVGAIRMQSYRLLALSNGQQSIAPDIAVLEHMLEATSFQRFIQHEKFETPYLEILQLWYSNIKPTLLTSEDKDEKLQAVESFIVQLNVLISQIDNHTEHTITTISQTQNIFIALTIIFLFLAFKGLHKRLFTPWRELLTIANAIRNGDFEQRFDSRHYRDEMAVLGETFNNMSVELKVMYDDLEERVHQKTSELKQQNDYLDFLYRSGQRFNRHHLNINTLSPLFQELISLLELHSVTFNPSDKLRYFIDEQIHYHHTIDHQMIDCQTPHDQTTDEQRNRAFTPQNWPVGDDYHEYGILQTTYRDKTLPSEKQKLIETFCDLFTQYLATRVQEQRKHQLLVIEERHTIARELHDSIAQSLSFLKIKSGILRMQSDNFSATQHELLEDISQEINAAYHQLRELLVTFRLKIDDSDLSNAIKNSVDEYSEKLGFAIQLNNQWQDNSITPHHFIHILQIIREALSNIYKHSKATEVTIHLTQDENKMCHLNIMDNGVGIEPQQQEMANHYGLTIIADRVKALDGNLTIDSKPDQGTEIAIQFYP
ncbi:histidine kinase [Vibrio sp. MEBiC08052]|uniref:histidine kinase n=1 Tax=Vibrio sp. MEBiC08052 TaxID=1761910 RepID=UPI00074085A1|nr:histidine kinase [Vibrio sp. MEBiC08052]KUI99650.1 hypothetical protein VRK_10960 [Vibrio sp. MEBiC08052]